MEFRQHLKDNVVVFIGCVMMALTMNAIYIPNHLLSSGISGIAMIVYFFFGTPIGTLSLILNIPLFIIAYRMMNRTYIFNALYGMIIVSVAIDMTTFAREWNFVHDPMLAAIYGGVFFGISSGMIFRVNGSTGGTDILAAIFRKYYGINMGVFGFLFNIVVMAAAAILFNPETAMYTLLSIFVSAQVTDKVVAGFNSKKAIWIITEEHEKISQSIFATMTRGVTVLDAVGAYTGHSKKMLYIVVTLTQTPKIREIVHEADPRAFMIIQDASEVLGQGKGFSSLGN